MERRHFLMTSAAATLAKSSALASPNDTVRVACVGVRGQGQSHIRAYGKMPNVEIAAICDVDESVLEQRLLDAEKLTKKRPAGFTDLRKVLEDKSIDAKIRLWEESRWLPAVAVGARDIGGTGLFSSEYIVTSKRAGPFDFSLGLAWGYIGNRGDIANPLATILSAAMMLRYTLNQSDAADRIESAVRSVLAAGLRTADIWREGDKRVGTREMGDAVVAAITKKTITKS